MFGKRAPEEWQEMVRQLDELDQQTELEDSPEVRATVAIVRNEILFSSLPPIQMDLWNSLHGAYRVGGLELMQIAFKNSSCNLADLLDLLYIADQLCNSSLTVSANDHDFREAVFDLLYRYRGARLDNQLANLFGADFQPIDSFLLRLAENEQLVRGRLDDYHDFWLKNNKEPRKRSAVEFQPIVAAALEKLVDLEASFDPVKEAPDYLFFMHEIGLSFDRINLELIEAVRDLRFLYNFLQCLIENLKSPSVAATYISGFDTVIAKLVSKMHSRGLVYMANLRLPVVYNERLLALSNLDDANQVSDEAVMELMLDRDSKQRKSVREMQQKLRQKILDKKILGDRAHQLRLATLTVRSGLAN